MRGNAKTDAKLLGYLNKVYSRSYNGWFNTREVFEGDFKTDKETGEIVLSKKGKPLRESLAASEGVSKTYTDKLFIAFGVLEVKKQEKTTYIKWVGSAPTMKMATMFKDHSANLSRQYALKKKLEKAEKERLEREEVEKLELEDELVQTIEDDTSFVDVVVDTEEPVVEETIEEKILLELKKISTSLHKISELTPTIENLVETLK